MQRTVIHGGYLMTRSGIVADSGVIIEGNRIAAAGPNASLLPNEGDTVIDATDKLIAPGFINGHNHMYGMLSHGITVEALVTEFSSFLEDFWWPYVENRVDHDLVRTTAAWNMVEMIDSGVTCFCDILEAPNSIPGALEIAAEVTEAAGLRGVLCFEACCRISEENGALGLKENADFIRSHNKPDSTVTGIMSIHTLFTCPEDYVSEAKAMAKELGADIHMHLSESVFEPTWVKEHLNSTPVEVYDKLGYLDDKVIASQCVQLSPDELKLLAKRGVRAVHMPLSNCEVGGGVAPVSDMLELGMKVGLGSDGYINNFFEIMRGAFLIPKAHWQSTTIMPAKAVYELATWRGAEALGIQAGALEEGLLADLITIDLDTPTPINPDNVYDQLVLFRNPQNVCDVMVNGRFLKRDHTLLTVDVPKAKSDLRDAAQRFWSGN